MNIIFTIIMIVFFVSCVIGGAIEIFGLDKEEEKKEEKEKKEEADTIGFATDFEHSAEVFTEFGKFLGGTSPVPEKKISITYTCVNCGAPIRSKHCEYCGTEYK